MDGFDIHKRHLPEKVQEKLVLELRSVLQAAPLYSPMTAWGKPMSVRLTSAGNCGWFSDRRGYRYIDRHPNGTPWPPIPDMVLDVWRELVSKDRMPDCCLINYYGEKSRMGLHRDADEVDFSWPVLSISLGDSATFRMGGLDRKDPTRSTVLESGDVVTFGGAARLAYHGIDRIRFGTSPLLKNGGRINLTLRVVESGSKEPGD